MLPYIQIFGRQLPTYGVLGVIGVVLGLLLSVLCCKRQGLNREDCAYIYVFGAVGAVVGAKVLYFFTVLPQLVQDVPLLWQAPAQFAAKYLSGGLVFYGGLLGAIGGAALCARYLSLHLRDFFPVFIPAFPLVHAIGRLGCFAAGCCYGKQASWGIAFSHSEVAPNGVKLIPTQLFEAAAEVLICLLLLWYARRRSPSMRLLALYFMIYAPVRFLLEFLRGDVVRGGFFGLSTSQWISIPIFLAGVLLWLRPALFQRETAKIQ
ncbi:MAG: prolipoprotein diacylglyceryl transferase [Oscillospiraceae bacterium]|nr:prolipoprotein diacylglyceryl transferase [Oscillospiraceae bacterium]